MRKLSIPTANTVIKSCKTALIESLDYLGDEDGECQVCGGNGKNLDYSTHCPCRRIRRALSKINRYSSDSK